MDFLIQFFHIVLYQPLFNILILLYLYLPGRDFGVAVVALTLLTRMIFYPLGAQALKSQKQLSELQPKIKEIQEKYKNDKAAQGKFLMELYQKEKINPLSGCLPLLLQLPILIALYQVFWKGLEAGQMTRLYSFVPHPGSIEPLFFGIVNLSLPSFSLALFAGILQFIQTKMITPRQKFSGGQKKGAPDFSQMMQQQMLYFFPVFTVLILLKLPSALALYWIVTSLFSIFQQFLLYRKKANV